MHARKRCRSSHRRPAYPGRLALQHSRRKPVFSGANPDSSHDVVAEAAKPKAGGVKTARIRDANAQSADLGIELNWT